MKVKIFSDSRIDRLEKEINEWLDKQDKQMEFKKIKRVLQSESQGDGFGVTITIFYEFENLES